MSTPNTLTNNSRESSRIHENSIMTSSPGSLLKGPKGWTKRSQQKFGFSSKQYKKLQIIKASRAINLKLIVSLNRLKYTKFYSKVLVAFIEMMCILYNKDEIDAHQWQDLISYIHKNQSSLLVEINNSSNV